MDNQPDSPPGFPLGSPAGTPAGSPTSPTPDTPACSAPASECPAGQSTFNLADKAALRQVAFDSIRCGLTTGQPLRVEPADYTPALRPWRATFVTLEIGKQLRGCVGRLVATQPLVVDVADSAFSAAFHDPRFAPLAAAEFAGLDLHISILGPPEPMSFTSQQDLLRQIRPGIDGLIMEEQLPGRAARRGTFLPAVWETLPDPLQFLLHLKVKAGLPVNYWSSTLTVQRYTAESV